MIELAAAIVFAVAIDALTARRGLLPPGFAESPSRRIAAGVLLASGLWLTVASSLGSFGAEPPSLEGAAPWVLFSVHAVLALVTGGWLLLGFAGTGRSTGDVLRGQLGLSLPDPREIALGIAAGIVAWTPAILCSLAVGLIAWALGWLDLEAKPPEMIYWIVGQSVALRAALALSAGFFEEVFFRGLLQPRIGIALSTILFVAAHAGYGQLPLLGGVGFLSLVFAGMVRWRGSLLAAIVAHATFDAVQLLIVIPALLRNLPELV